MRPLAVVLALLVAGLALFMIARPRRETGAKPIDAVIMTDDRVLAALESLRDEVAGLRSELRELAQRCSGERVAAAEETALRSAVTALSERVDGLLAGRSSDVRAEPKLREEGPGFPSLDAIWAAFDEGRPPRAVFQNESKPSIMGGLSQAHMWWTLERVLNTYGPPTSASEHSNGLCLLYRRESPGCSLIEFVISNGRVIRVTEQYG